MRTRRANNVVLSNTLAEMIDQFQESDIVTSMLAPRNIMGVVREVNRKTNKVLVAWNGGAVSQHDPDEIMLMPYVDEAVRSRFQVAMTAGMKTRRAKKEEAVLKCKRCGKTLPPVKGYESAGWRHCPCGGVAVRASLNQQDRKASIPSGNQFVGDPATHGIDTPRGGGFSIMQDLQADLAPEIKHEHEVGPLIAGLKSRRARMGAASFFRVGADAIVSMERTAAAGPYTLLTQIEDDLKRGKLDDPHWLEVVGHGMGHTRGADYIFGQPGSDIVYALIGYAMKHKEQEEVLKIVRDNIKQALKDNEPFKGLTGENPRTHELWMEMMDEKLGKGARNVIKRMKGSIDKIAMEFSDKKQLDEYLKKHPDADRSKHKVVPYDPKNMDTHPYNLSRKRKNEEQMETIAKALGKAVKDLTNEDIQKYNEKRRKGSIEKLATEIIERIAKNENVGSGDWVQVLNGQVHVQGKVGQVVRVERRPFGDAIVVHVPGVYESGWVVEWKKVSAPEGKENYRASEREAMDFPSEEARKKYLDEHPSANPRNHHVVKTEADTERRKMWDAIHGSVNAADDTTFVTAFSFEDGKFWSEGRHAMRNEEGAFRYAGQLVKEGYDVVVWSGDVLLGYGGRFDEKTAMREGTGTVNRLTKTADRVRTIRASEEAPLRSRRALYWNAPGRVYRMTRSEQENGSCSCPKCRIDMEKQPFTRSEKLLNCPECGFKVPTSKVTDKRIEIEVSPEGQVDVEVTNASLKSRRGKA